MKTKKNYPTKRKIELFGKSYFDYLKVEVEKGQMTFCEFKFWSKINRDFKVPSMRIFRTSSKLIPYNS